MPLEIPLNDTPGFYPGFVLYNADDDWNYVEYFNAGGFVSSNLDLHLYATNLEFGTVFQGAFAANFVYRLYPYYTPIEMQELTLEYTQQCEMALLTINTVGDLDYNYVLDFNDATLLLELVSAGAPYEGNEIADVNFDEQIDIMDFTVLVAIILGLVE